MEMEWSMEEALSNHDIEDIVEPAVGMEFDSIDAVKAFYKKYSTEIGFGWKIRNSKKGPDGEVNYFIFACIREGNKQSNVPTTLKTLPTVAAKCEAKITVKKGGCGKWCVKTVVLQHCHDVSPSKARMFKKNKNISMHVKRTIELHDEVGVRINKTFQTLVHDVGGHENLQFIEKDVRNYIHKERRLIGKEGDAKALVDYFSRMKEQNNNFWYDIDLDEEFRIRNIFWADGRSRAEYEGFGDIVSFNTTYLTNKYEMPFAAFVGVNHHGQSVLLGCGLVSAEDTETFVWLFNCWVNCMSGKPPNGIVTDQCKAMQNAIAIALPDTRHRWCLWHIMKKIPEKLKGYGAYKQIKSAMKEAVYDSLTREEFEDKWFSFLKQYEVENNEWLAGLFNQCHRWVPIFLRKDFWAGLSTTQRSESIHAFFYRYLNSKTSLQQFVKQYENALRSKVEKEVEADFRTMNTTIQCGSTSPIERQFQAEYTNSKFAEVQAEFRGKMNCAAVLNCQDGTIASYIVAEDIIFGNQSKEAKFEVVFNRDSHDVTCQCLLFEFRGIMCKHSLSVLALEKVKQVPCKYILSRWSKMIKRRHSYIKSSYDKIELQPMKERYDKLCHHFYNVAEIVADSEEASNLLYTTLDQFTSKLPSISCSSHNLNRPSNDPDISKNRGEGCPIQLNEIHSPKSVTRKGRPPTKRKISQCEKVVTKYRKQSIKSSNNLVIEESLGGMLTEKGGSSFCIESSVEVVSRANLNENSSFVFVRTKLMLNL